MKVLRAKSERDSEEKHYVSKTPGKPYAFVSFKIASERPAIITGPGFVPSKLASEVTFSFSFPNHCASALFNPLDISRRFRT